MRNIDQEINRLISGTPGLTQEYQTADGNTMPRVYLDNAATTLRLGFVDRVIQHVLPHYANTHSESHFSAKYISREYHWAHDTMLDFVAADKSQYSSFFTGNGSTAALNHIAYTLKSLRPEKDVVIASVMEHHANDLPHRKYFKHVIHAPVDDHFGMIDLDTLETIIKQFNGRINYIAISGVSNVTGIINPIDKIAELAHQYDALIVVDAAQMAAHIPIKVSNPNAPEQDLDIVTFSGHKLYCPSAPGVVITRSELFNQVEPFALGGGMVEDVYSNRYITLSQLPDREEAGTPNLIGAIALAATLHGLQRIGMDTLFEKEQQLTGKLLTMLSQFPDITIYGDTDYQRTPRVGCIAFNIRGIHHGLTAAILNDYFNIAVRNGCFCAHPYVRELVTQDIDHWLDEQNGDIDNETLEKLTEQTRGMVRASLGIYNTHEDITRLEHALKHILANRKDYVSQYQQIDKNLFRHRRFNSSDSFPDTVAEHVDRMLTNP